MSSAVGEQNILVTPPGSRVRAGDPAQAWRWIGWFGLLFLLAGCGDWVLAWLPLRIGSPEWEFGTVVSSFAGLPLVTLGFAALLGSALARAIRWQAIVAASLMLLFAAWMLGALILFLLDVPVAMRAVEGAARLGIMKAIAKTSFLGVLFLVGYLVAAIAALRHVSRRRAS
jgi:hypothetical protein